MRRNIKDQLELGISILQHVESQLNRADSKAQFTFTLDTLLIASSAFFGQGVTSNAALSSTGPFLYLVATLSAAVFFALFISTIYALLAVIPRLTPKKNARNNIFYFGNIVQLKREDFVEDYLDKSQGEIQKMLMSEVYDLSIIAERKFSLVRVSHIFLFISLGFWSILQTILVLIP